jgi:glycosyl transferase, family 25
VGNDFEILFDCFVISLARTPEGLESFRTQNVKCDINFRRFEAIDGAQIDETVISQIVAGPMPFKRSLIGNACSHRMLWQRCSEQAKNFIILEDDAVVRHDAKSRLPDLISEIKDWDIILLGSNTDVPLELSIAPGIIYGGGFSASYPTAQQLSDFAASSYPVGLNRLVLALGTCGYVVSPKGSRALMRGCFPLDQRVVKFNSINHSVRASALDGMMASIYPELAAYACLAPLVMTANNKATSTTKE